MSRVRSPSPAPFSNPASGVISPACARRADQLRSAVQGASPTILEQRSCSATTGCERVPAYRLHKSSGRAVVRLNNHDHYLGTRASCPACRPSDASACPCVRGCSSGSPARRARPTSAPCGVLVGDDFDDAHSARSRRSGCQCASTTVSLTSRRLAESAGFRPRRPRSQCRGRQRSRPCPALG